MLRVMIRAVTSSFLPSLALRGLSCFACNRLHDLARLQTVCVGCGMPLRVDYDLTTSTLPLASLRGRAPTLWRYQEVLPLSDGEVKLVPGTIAAAGKWLREHGPRDAFDVSTLKEPYRIEGKKTMAYELYEQFDGDLPDVIVYPTGGGTGLVGMWKAFAEMQALGWPMRRVPRLVSVQAAGCAPVVRGWVENAERTVAWPDPATRAWGLRVPSPIGGFLC